MFSVNTFCEYIMSYETFWNFISVVTRLHYGRYIGKVWNKYENEHRSNKTFSTSILYILRNNNLFIWPRYISNGTIFNTYYIFKMATRTRSGYTNLFIYIFAVSCNFYNINWQICFKFVVSHHSTKKSAKCFITYSKYNKDIKRLLAFILNIHLQWISCNFCINFQIFFEFNQYSHDGRVSLQCWAIFKMFYIPNTIWT